MGTAGHVDHGKTTLVKTLTGVDLDTLPEEKARGMTINLGFTSFDTPSGLRIGVVDVPGHRRFIKTMLAGAHGLDFVLFLVAGDDSVMPQTREHLQILRLLGVEHGIIALTKSDLVDRELREMVEAEVRELTAGTFLAEAPLIPVSSVTGEGVPELIRSIDELATKLRPRERGSYFRMWVDRVFSVAGAGTVATGTALSGMLAAGDEVEIMPGGDRARVRKLELHGESAEKARAGQRVALNLRLVEKGKVERGDLLATPGLCKPTYMIDARLELLSDYPKPLLHWTRVRLYLGTREIFGRVVLLDLESALPGASLLCQLRLESPAPAVTGDPFVIRDFSANWTIGGGKILDAHPVKHKRRKALVTQDLERRETGYLEEILEMEVKKAGYFAARNEIAAELDVPLDQIGVAAGKLSAGNQVVILPPKKSPWLIHLEAWSRITGRLIAILAEHHAALPQLETGVSEQELRDRISRAAGVELPAEPFHSALAKLTEDRVLKLVEGTYALSEHTASLRDTDQAALAKIRARYSENRFQPPETEDLYQQSGLPRAVVREFLEKLIAEGALIRVSREFLFEKSAVESARERMLKYIDERGTIAVSEFRDLTGTTRKYAVPLLTFFDSLGYTARDGDVRRRGLRQG